MNFVNYFNSLKTKKQKDLSTRELSLLIREHYLNKMLTTEDGSVDTEAVMNQLETEYKQAVELNSVANISTKAGG
ncbi:MAG: hypothetical protein Q4B28_06910 [bacterium]|nr:hypothetical protein [bacterium]